MPVVFASDFVDIVEIVALVEQNLNSDSYLDDFVVAYLDIAAVAQA